MKTLEEVLQILGSKKPFLKEIIIDVDGHKQPFTKSGSVAYGKLVDILYTIGELTNTNVNDIIEELDNIAQEI